ncbi:MAG: NAD(P)H-binding protein [Fodinibius sp.]|nr:NAD(P)H-binding protein [Fodinibius sp.]
MAKNCLVTGVTGYIGGRLVPKLLEKGYNVRVLARDAGRLQGRRWIDNVEVVEADVLKPETLGDALEGIDIAYYLIHSMSGKGDSNFHKRDMQAAQNFGDAARAENVDRIIYLGGLGNPDDQLSKHLSSRQETGETLRASGIPVTEFRAAIVVGSGSKSFRDGALPYRASADNDMPLLGVQQGTTDRHPQRAAIFGFRC